MTILYQICYNVPNGGSVSENKKINVILKCGDSFVTFPCEAGEDCLIINRMTAESIYSQLTIIFMKYLMKGHWETMATKIFKSMRGDNIPTSNETYINPPILPESLKEKNPLLKTSKPERYTDLQVVEMASIKKKLNIKNNSELDIWIAEWGTTRDTKEKTHSDINPANINDFIDYMKTVLP